MTGKKPKASKAAPRHALRVTDALEQMESRRRKATEARKPGRDLDLDFIP